MLATFQLICGVLAAAFAAHDAGYDSGEPAGAYMRVAAVLRGPTMVSLTYALGTAAVLAGATSSGATRRHLYAAYLLGWAAFVTVAVVATQVVRPWPGQLTHRWIAVHNLHAIDLPAAELVTLPRNLMALSPAWWAVAVMAALRRVRRRGSGHPTGS